MILPKFYYYRRGVSDRNFIEVRMAHIPPSKQKEVADRYEQLYLKNKLGRKAANEYLHGVASEYRNKRLRANSNGKI